MLGEPDTLVPMVSTGRTRTSRAMLALAAALGLAAAGAVVLRAQTAPSPAPASPARPAIDAPAGTLRTPPAPGPAWLAAGDPREHVGSAACQSCHEAAYDQWRQALHLQMLKPVAEAQVIGDFRPGTSLEQHGRRYRFESKAGAYFVSVARGDGPFERFDVHFTLGVHRYQGYLSTLPDGRIYVLPVFWHRQNQRWIDWKEITPVPDGDHDLRQIWNLTCFNCHATNLVKGFSFEARRYDTTWTELGIGCEACHGPGRAHVELTNAWQRDPATRPVYDTAPPMARSARR